MRKANLSRSMRLCGALVVIWLLLSVIIAVIDWNDRWTLPDRSFITVFKLWLFWASLAAPAMLVGALAQSWRARGTWHALPWLAFAAVLAVGGWSRLVEPHLLVERTTHIPSVPVGAQPLRLALVSDVHLGLFVRRYQLDALVNRLNQLDVDAVIVAGDWSYDPPRDLAAAFAPLRKLRHPLYATLGNHDVQAPGPPLTAALRGALAETGVVWLEGRDVAFKGWCLSGLDDAWGGHPGPQIAAWNQQDAQRRIVVVHQPDTVASMPPGSAFLALSGHTHGGQIALPWLTARVLRGMSRQGWYDGLYRTPAAWLVVSRGTGSIGLPARLGTPPTIDVVLIGEPPPPRAGR